MNLKILAISNNGRYNKILLNRSDEFLSNIEGFLRRLELVSPDGVTQTENDTSLQFITSIEEQDRDGKFTSRPASLADFRNGTVVRFFSDNIELLIIFLEQGIMLIFFCEPEMRKKVMDALLAFCEMLKP
jgi:hypothetical protein